MATTRLRFLDIARGATMFFVLLSHFGSVYFRSPSEDGWRMAFVRIGMVATPTFVILSGVLIGVLYQRCRSRFSRIQTKLIDRGLFLLLIGHLLISVVLRGETRIQHWSFSTDAIGVSMILGALIIPLLSGRARVFLSAAAYVWSWVAVYGWMPGGVGAPEFAKEIFFGSLTPVAFPAGSFPLVPWVAVYLASSVFGERLASLHQRGATRQLIRELTALGIGGVVVMAAVKLAALELGISPLTGSITSELLRVGQKYPPGPLYLLFYGGFSMLLLLSCVVAESRNWVRRVLRCAEACGEVSLFIFIAHFYLYYLVLYKLGPGGPGRGLVYFAASVAALVAAAELWQRHGWNRLFTVGYEAAHKRFVVPLGLPSEARLGRAVRG
jgi:uncharacterized membrane protein